MAKRPEPPKEQRPVDRSKIVMEWSDNGESSRARVGPTLLSVWIGRDGWQWVVQDAENGQALMGGGATDREAGKIAATAACWQALGFIW